MRHAVEAFRLGRLDQAEERCGDLLRADPDHCDALHLLALVTLQRGRVPQAIERLRQALALSVHNPVIRTNLATALLLAGSAQEALGHCDSALTARPDYTEALNTRGNALLQLGMPDEALRSYERALVQQPQLAFLHCNRGNALRDLKRPQEALGSYQRALTLQPSFREAILGAGTMLRVLKRPEEVRAHCSQLLHDAPQDVEALHLRAGIGMDGGRYQEALADLELALSRRPHATHLLLDRGNALFHLERPAEALMSYERALQLAPNDADVLFNRGNVLLHMRRAADALASYDAALALKPEFVKAHYHRGNALLRLLRIEEAITSYGRALAFEPGYVDALVGVGNGHRALDRLSDALTSYDCALQFDPHSRDALIERSRALLEKWPEEAAETLKRLLDNDPAEGPEFGYALGLLLYTRLRSCDWRDYEATCTSLRTAIEANQRVTAPWPSLSWDDSPQRHRQCARSFLSYWADRARLPDIAPSRRRRSRIRLAYISADFRLHPVSQLMVGILESHDREKFEVIGVTLTAADESPLCGRVRAAFEHFIDVTRQPDEQVVQVLRELEVDIAIDLTGFTGASRHGILFRRVAPVQVNYLGYPGTLADPQMDYIIADRVAIPPEQQAFYAENVVYLPGSYLPPADRRGLDRTTPSRASCALPDGAFVFCSFNMPYKIQPRVFALWMRLLHATEQSVLWLSTTDEGCKRNLMREAEGCGIDPARLVFAPRVPELADHLARHRCADLFLDTLPYNAHSTASDALWAGLPVLTCRGNSFQGRVGASLLGALGLPELITGTLEEYEARALHYATSPAELLALRARLWSQRDSHPAFDLDLYRRRLESAYATMWQRYERGEPAAAFDVAESP
jgi:predicted O-linked N-acetylglucosamine transferase (SPINDLY family)